MNERRLNRTEVNDMASSWASASARYQDKANRTAIPPTDQKKSRTGKVDVRRWKAVGLVRAGQENTMPL